MLLSLIYFLPCIVSLLWFFSYLLKQKNSRQKLFCYAEGISVVFYAILAIYLFPNVDYEAMVRMEVISIPSGVLFPAFLVAYLYMLCMGKKLNDKLTFMLIVPAIVLAVAIGLLCRIIGFDNAAVVSRQFASVEGLSGTFDTSINRLYCFFTYDLFISLAAIYILLIFAICFTTLHHHGYRFGDVFRFFFRGKPTSRPRTIAVMYIVEMSLMVLMLSTGSVYFTKHILGGVAIMVLLAAVKHIIAYIEFYSDDDRLVTLYELSHLSLLSSVREDALIERDSSVRAQDAVHVTTPGQVKIDRRVELFRILMEEKKIWMNEDLTSQSICEMMNIGKTTLSALISQHYDSTLRDLINKYRIEEAKSFMAANPQATQETVALHCGFRNAQYFNTQFKKIVGDTPAMWLAGNNRNR